MPSFHSKVDTVIIGGGVSGLACALLLSETGQRVCVLEAQRRPGGRIRSVHDERTGEFLADLGPTWIWPSYQPMMKRWIERLGLSTFPQYSEGNAILDNGAHAEPQVCFLPDQDGNVRIVGGSQAVIDALVQRLPSDALKVNAPVSEVSVLADGVHVRVGSDDQYGLMCEHLIIATPPRIALSGIKWGPVLPGTLVAALQVMPTWMAQHAKVVALYDSPFWRERGLSGRIASREGPIVEGHDHSGPACEPAAIFGFVGWPHDMRAKVGDGLKDLVHAQLMRCFGAGSPEPRSIHVEDWSRNSFIASPDDLSGPMDHPTVGSEILRQPQFDGRVFFAGAESASQSPGLLEGAFVAAERTVESVTGFVPIQTPM